MRGQPMFRIPNFYLHENMNFDEAVAIVKGRAKGDLLEGMYAIDALWEEHVASSQDDDDFYSNWEYELNAYNIVFKNMKTLFVGG